MRALFRGRWLAAAVICVAAGLNQPAAARQDPGDGDPPGPEDQPAAARQDPGDGDPPGPEVLNRGPIHEAFANPITYDATPGPVVPKQPPDPIDEQPPDTKPEGDDVQWIPGYWAWDDERTDFIWISGVWRVPPPDRQWTPGYWDQCDDGNGGWRWTCGCWTPVDQEDGQYLPAPPPSVEQGPTSPPPADDGSGIWNPGYWSWTEATDGAAARYVWRPGCWTTYTPDWLWVPPRYIPTACGYLFVRGFWDYPIERRGILFAPIACGPGIGPGFVYRPSVCISTVAITSCLFVRPNCQAYCFGDYFDARYSSMGIYPCYAYHRSRYGCDPIYAHCAASHFREPGWTKRLYEEYRYRREHPSVRPPHTYKESLKAQHQAVGRGGVSHLALAMSVHKLAEHQPMIRRISRVHPNQLQSLAQSRERLQQIASHRRTAEINAARHPQRDLSKPMHVKLPGSPVASRIAHGPGSTAPHTVHGPDSTAPHTVHGSGSTAPHTVHGPGSTAPHGPGLPPPHPTAPTARHVPPPHPSYPQPDHRVLPPGPRYTPNRPEPHHDLPPPEHRSPGHPQHGSPVPFQSHSQPNTMTRLGTSTPTAGPTRHRQGTR